LESINSIPLRGRPLTLSFKVRRGDTANQAADALGIYIVGGTGTDERLSLGFTGATVLGSRIIAPSTSWTTYTITTSSAVGAYTQIGVVFDYVPVGTAGASDYIDITEVKLERGTVATPFVQKPYAEELRNCLWYFRRKLYAAGVINIAQGIAISATTSIFLISLDQMRAIPSVTPSSGVTTMILNANSTNLAITSLGADSITTNSFRIVGYVTSGFTQYGPVTLATSESNPATFDISAEL